MSNTKELASEELSRKIRDWAFQTGRSLANPHHVAEITKYVFRANPELAERYRYEPDQISKHGVDEVRRHGI